MLQWQDCMIVFFEAAADVGLLVAGGDEGACAGGHSGRPVAAVGHKPHGLAESVGIAWGYDGAVFAFHDYFARAVDVSDD